jgi:hypothetical protein
MARGSCCCKRKQVPFGFAQGRLSTTPSLALRAPVGMTKGVG